MRLPAGTANASYAGRNRGMPVDDAAAASAWEGPHATRSVQRKPLQLSPFKAARLQVVMGPRPMLALPLEEGATAVEVTGTAAAPAVTVKAGTNPPVLSACPRLSFGWPPRLQMRHRCSSWKARGVTQRSRPLSRSQQLLVRLPRPQGVMTPGQQRSQQRPQGLCHSATDGPLKRTSSC